MLKKKKIFWTIFATFILIVWIVLICNDFIEKEKEEKRGFHSITNKAWISLIDVENKAAAVKVIFKFYGNRFSFFLKDYKDDEYYIEAARGFFSIKNDKLILAADEPAASLLYRVVNYEFFRNGKEILNYSFNDDRLVIFNKHWPEMVFLNIYSEKTVDYYGTEHFKISCPNEYLKSIIVIVDALERAKFDAEQFFEKEFKEKIVNVFVYKDTDDLRQEYFRRTDSTSGISGFAVENEIFIISPSYYEDYKEALITAAHEYIHTAVREIYPYDHYPHYPLIGEGIAIYLSDKDNILSKDDVQTLIDYNNQDMYMLFYDSDSFIERDGYLYAGYFIAYIYNTYGKYKVWELLENNDYEKVLGKDIETIYDEWKNYLKKEYYFN